ncbi:sodium:proton antiporter [Ramlibacter sp. RBP-2]|uniref:Sodium:proton antiporter n=1 Tax=Ramlibacter lithotrophicus TaxID=2606681 RepID=A0A7X6DF26_9BURK|nr:cation:proton antiporter [Ramlibacter lithotrophicus]NKE66012.1 sodium:proton antiporter [Ramlibacter lithotrophicus]
MDFAFWSVLVGVLLIFLALSGTVLSRLPLSTAMLYLALGLVMSPLGLNWLAPDLRENKVLLERLTETVVLVSLFTAGLKLSVSLRDRRWLLPLRLALTSMVLTVVAIAAVGTVLLGLPLGAAVLLGAILAPTDPVLASDVQVHRPGDRDKLRFALTGEGGLNDGTAFPFVMLGLGLLGLHEIGPWGWRWLAVDVLWAVAAGLAAGALLGAAVGRLVLFLRRKHKEAVGLDDFLALGLIALSYGVAVLLHGYGFLAVFAAGVALRQVEQAESRDPAVQQAVEQASADPDFTAAEAAAVDPRHAPAFMAHAVLGFNQQVERIGELAIVITIGALLWAVEWDSAAWWFVPVLLLVVRPAATWLGLLGSHSSARQRRLVAWFGIRGIGSLYYLMYAINHGLPDRLAAQLTALTLSVVVTSIFVHGISVTPLMRAYERAMGRRAASRPPVE